MILPANNLKGSAMSSRFGRREFLKKSAGAAALAAGAPAVGVPAILAERSPNSKLNTAVIGASGRGMAHVPVAANEHLVAMVDIDDRRMASTLDWIDKNHPGVRSKIKTYYDYRKMFDEMHKQVDAVFIAIPDHSHACATHDGHQARQARLLRKAADARHLRGPHLGPGGTTVQSHDADGQPRARERKHPRAPRVSRGRRDWNRAGDAHLDIPVLWRPGAEARRAGAEPAYIGTSGSAPAPGAIIAPACTLVGAHLPGTSGKTTARASCLAWESMPSTPFTGACN